MVEIKDLFDLDKTIAKELFAGKTYPWEVLDEIKSFILTLGPTLDPEEFDHPAEGVWVASGSPRTRRSSPRLTSARPASSTTARRSATAPSSAAAPSSARTPSSATAWS